MASEYFQTSSPHYGPAAVPALLPSGVGRGLGTLTGKLTPLAQKGTSAYVPKDTMGSRGLLPGSIIQQQAEKIGTIAGTKPNPLADKANWNTGGRQTSFGAGSATGNPMMWTYLIGAGLILFLVARRRRQ